MSELPGELPQCRPSSHVYLPFARNGPPDIPSPSSRPARETYVQFHASRMQMLCGNDGDRVEVVQPIRRVNWAGTSGSPDGSDSQTDSRSSEPNPHCVGQTWDATQPSIGPTSVTAVHGTKAENEPRRSVNVGSSARRGPPRPWGRACPLRARTEEPPRTVTVSHG